MTTTFSPKRMYRALVFVGIMICVAGALFFLLHRERVAISNQVDTHVSENTRVADLLRIARLAREEGSLVTDIASTFQSATDTVAVIESLENIRNKTRVLLTIRQAEKAQSDADGRFLMISADATGDWQSVYRFFAALDTFPYKHLTQKVSFSKITEPVKGRTEWVVTIEMKVFLQQ